MDDFFLEGDYERRKNYMRMLSNVCSFLKQIPKAPSNGWLLHAY